MSAKSRLAKVTLASDVEQGAELVKWSCKEGYVYVPIPPAGSAGHYADKWDVDKWFKALKVELVATGDNMVIRLSDQETAELFAECPLPGDGTPLTTAVEPVVDSSRYFVLRVVDRETGKHAFIGLGFRERGDASSFTAGLDEYRKYLRRKEEADVMKAEYERQENGEGGPQRDYSLKENIVIPLKIGRTKRQEAEGASSTSSSRSKPTAEAAAKAMEAVKLAPPPPAAAPGSRPSDSFVASALPMQTSGELACESAAGTRSDGHEWGDFTGSG